MDADLTRLGNIEHEAPEPPLASKFDDNELNSLSAVLNDFLWSNDTVEKAAMTILDFNTSTSAKYESILAIKKLLCTTRDQVFPIAQEVIDSGVLRRLVYFISSSCPQNELKLPSAFCLTNIAAGSDDQTAAVVEAGAIESLLELLQSNDHQLRRQAVFCLANIAGSTPEYRKKLAEHPQYFKAINYALSQSSEVRIEELAGWNIRNMIVLGGPSLRTVIPGLYLFIEQLSSYVPDPIEAYHLIVNGSASLSSLHYNTSNWFKYGAIDPISNATSYINGTANNSQVLRFITESFSFISKSSEGRDFIIENKIILSLLYLAKFCAFSSVRNYCLEIIANLAEFCDESVKMALVRSGCISGLGELISDGYSYSPHQRSLAGVTLNHICKILKDSDIMLTITPTIATRTSLLNQRQSIMNKLTQFNDTKNYFDLSKASPNSCLVSLLEIVYKCFKQYDGSEEIGLREKSARIIITILKNLPNEELLKFINKHLLNLLLDITEIATEIDLASLHATTSDDLSFKSNEKSGVSVYNTLDISKSNTDQNDFTSACLQIFQKIINICEEINPNSENPAVLLLEELKGFSLIKECIVKSSMNLNQILQTLNFLDAYE